MEATLEHAVEAGMDASMAVLDAGALPCLWTLLNPPPPCSWESIYCRDKCCHQAVYL